MPSTDYTDPTAVSDMATTAQPRYGQTASGYGRKLPTRFTLRYKGRQHRVYVMCFGNAGSAYIVHNGRETFLDSDTEHALIRTLT